MASLPEITVRVYNSGATKKQLLCAIFDRLESVMTTQAEHATQLEAVAAQVTKTREETLARIAALQAAIEAAGNTTAEVESAMALLRATVQASDDVVPDTPPA
jgi:ABC-type transporter Mla subunit MlaD